MDDFVSAARYLADFTFQAQDSFFEAEGEACRDMDCRHECVSAAVVSGGDGSPVFKVCEHVFDQVALFIQMPVVRRL